MVLGPAVTCGLLELCQGTYEDCRKCLDGNGYTVTRSAHSIVPHLMSYSKRPPTMCPHQI
jgi:hypothetical protein